MKVSELLTSPAKWTHGTWARDSKGFAVSVLDEKAVRFCLSGAILKCYPEKGAYEKIYHRIVQRVGMTPMQWNDAPGRTFEEVRTLVLEMNL